MPTFTPDIHILRERARWYVGGASDLWSPDPWLCCVNSPAPFSLSPLNKHGFSVVCLCLQDCHVCGLTRLGATSLLLVP